MPKGRGGFFLICFCGGASEQEEEGLVLLSDALLQPKLLTLVVEGLTGVGHTTLCCWLSPTTGGLSTNVVVGGDLGFLKTQGSEVAEDSGPFSRLVNCLGKEEGESHVGGCGEQASEKTSEKYPSLSAVAAEEQDREGEKRWRRSNGELICFKGL